MKNFFPTIGLIASAFIVGLNSEVFHSNMEHLLEGNLFGYLHPLVFFGTLGIVASSLGYLATKK